MHWKSTVPTWGSFLATVLGIALTAYWRGKDMNAPAQSTDWADIRYWSSILLLLGGVIGAGILNWKASRNRATLPYGSSGSQSNAGATFEISKARSAANPPAPDLYVRYETSPSHSKLVFSTNASDSINIQKVGRLVSEEWYRCEHDIGLLRTAYHPVEANSPSDCPLEARFSELLARGLPETRNSISIEYSYKQGTYSTVFYLHKNTDGSIVSTTIPPVPVALDLDQLREKRNLLNQAVRQTYRGRRVADATEGKSSDRESTQRDHRYELR